MNLNNKLLKSIQTGFIDQSISSNKNYQPKLLTNEPKIGKKVLTNILQGLENCDEFWFSVAFITTSGVATIINQLIELEKKGKHGKILTSQYLNFTQPEALRRIKKFKNIELKISTEGELHSKGYIFRKNDLFNIIIGSSNLTAAALCSNKEWNLKVSAMKRGDIIKKIHDEFIQEFNKAKYVTDEYLNKYEKIWKPENYVNHHISKGINLINIKPNQMQEKALKNIANLRDNGNSKALLISATGTGKTYLSAFDVLNFNPKKFLFIVHRLNIAEAAMKTFKTLIKEKVKMGIFSGKKQELDADYVFSTIQTISKQEHLNKFQHNHFEYIVIDESHRSGADSYKKIINYFKPKFL